MRLFFLAAFLVALQSPSLATPADTLQKLSGMHERSHRSTLRKTLGVDPVRVPWCGYATAWAVRKATGKKPPAGYPRAVSWKRWGKSVTISSARRGDIMVVKTRRGHHVGIYTGQKKNGRACLIGGNQSSRVGISCYGRIVAVRR